MSGVKGGHTLVLKLDQSEIPIKQFREAVTAFFDLIESVSLEAAKDGADQGKPVKWTISVESGSARVVARSYASQATTVQRALPAGLKLMESGTAVTPPKFWNERAISAARKLASVGGSGADIVPIQILAGRTRTQVTAKTIESAEGLIGSSHQAFGSLEGRLRMLHDEGDSLRFAIYQPLFKRTIPCFVADPYIQSAIDAFRHRVKVTGRIQYNRYGVPISVKVSEKIEVFPNDGSLPTIEEMRGILK